ncbi:MAG: hypothetical protein AB7V32_09650 [Candidatus Berkiella sp.]
MRKAKLSPNQKKIMELKADITKIEEKLKKAKEIHDSKLKSYDAETAFINSFEGDVKIDALNKSIARISEETNFKDIDEYIKKREYEIYNYDVLAHVKKSYDEEISVSNNKEMAIERAVFNIVSNIKVEERIFLKERVLNGIINFENTYEQGPSKADFSSEQYVNVINAQLTYNTIACIIAAELTLLNLNELVDKSADINVHANNFMERTLELGLPLAPQVMKGNLNIAEEDINKNIDQLNEKYENEISDMEAHLLSQIRSLILSNVQKLYISFFDLPFLHESMSLTSNVENWTVLCSQYLIAVNSDLHDIYSGENDSLEHEFSLTKSNDRGLILLSLLDKHAIVHSLTEKNVQACVEKTDELVKDFIQSTKSLINVSSRILKCKGKYLMRVVTILENRKG